MPPISIRDSAGAVAAFLQEAAATIQGEVRDDKLSRYLYATDGSVYEVQPIGVAFPRCEADVVALVRLAGRHDIPLIPRGAGTSLNGQVVGGGLVLDFSRYMNRILAVDLESRTVTVEPGVVCDAVNQRVARHGLRFAPDPSTSSRATIGGMIGNNASGAHSIKYGTTADCIVTLRVVLTSGDVIETRPLAVGGPELTRILDAGTQESRLYQTVLGVTSEYAAEIAERYPDIPRNVSGYNLRTAVHNGVVDLSRLICGSEGTLGIVTQAVLRLEPLPQQRAVTVLCFADLVTAMEAVMPLRAEDVSAIELIDRTLLDLAAQTRYRYVTDSFPPETQAVLVVEVEGDDAGEVAARAVHVAERARAEFGVLHAETRTEPARQREIWNMRKEAVPLLFRVPGDAKPVPFIEDMAVGPQHLPAYVRGLLQLFERHQVTSCIYAHASVGCLHVRPVINLKEPDGVEKMARIAREACELVLSLGGVMSGEHGDGLSRTQWNRLIYGDRLWQAFQTIKRAFDPENLLNPGKVCSDEADLTQQLRYGKGYRTADWLPVLDFSDQGSFQQAVELCNGCGQCRKPTGLMCPTFRVSGEEIMTTRGRANLIRGALAGRLDPDMLFSPEFRQQVLDYCIACKGCRVECPSGVDMARIKAEVLYHYNQRHGKPLRSRLLARIRTLNRMGSATAPVSNALLGSTWVRALMEGVTGIDRRRRLPAFARVPFSVWMKSRGTGVPPLTGPGAAAGSTPVGKGISGRVLVFPDCFLEYNHPGIGMAAVRVLERAGLQVGLAPAVACCGRPAVSEGLLDEARAFARRNVDVLLPLVDAGWDIVGVEPSCTATFRHEVRELLGLRDPGAARLAEHFWDVTEYLGRLLDSGALDQLRADYRRAQLPPDLQELAFHGHCHQKSLRAHLPTARVLEAVAGARVHVIDAGCCGMAGSFGYKREYYDLSIKMSEFVRQAIESAGGTVVASGTSCMSQFVDLYGWRVLHPVEVLDRVLEERSIKGAEEQWNCTCT